MDIMDDAMASHNTVPASAPHVSSDNDACSPFYILHCIVSHVIYLYNSGTNEVQYGGTL